MTLTEQIYAQALLLAGELEQRRSQLLQILCTAATSSLESRLRDGITPEDCKADFIAAASLYALAALNEVGDTDRLEEISAGDLTLRKNSADAAANCLRNQAQIMIVPYLKDRFSFQGV